MAAASNTWSRMSFEEKYAHVQIVLASVADVFIHVAGIGLRDSHSRFGVKLLTVVESTQVPEGTIDQAQVNAALKAFFELIEAS